MQKLTQSEKRLARAAVLDGSSDLGLWDNDDGTWALEIQGTQVVLEAPSAAAALRELAHILEEA